MSLIFCGDLTLPFGINIDIEDIKPLFANHEAIANLPVGGINLVHT